MNIVTQPKPWKENLPYKKNPWVYNRSKFGLKILLRINPIIVISKSKADIRSIQRSRKPQKCGWSTRWRPRSCERTGICAIKWLVQYSKLFSFNTIVYFKFWLNKIFSQKPMLTFQKYFCQFVRNFKLALNAVYDLFINKNSVLLTYRTVPKYFY